MKHILLFAALFCLTTLGCRKADTITPPDTENYMYAFKDNKKWIAESPTASYSPSNNYLFIGGGDGTVMGWLSINLVVPESPTTLQQFDAGITKIEMGDIITDHYSAQASGNNYIKITSIDKNAKRITGEFQMTLVRDQHFSNKGESIKFTKGKFAFSYKTLN